MAKKKVFRMRSEPIKPTRKTDIQEEYSMYDGVSFEEMVQWAESHHLAFENIRFAKGSRYYGCDYEETYLVGTREETDDELNIRMKDYEKKLADYRRWETDHAKEIEAVKAEKEEQAKQRAEQEALRKQKQAEKELADCEKKAKKLRKQLGLANESDILYKF